MARERLADLDESKEDERERKLKLQEKNRRAQQAFRWRQKVRILLMQQAIVLLGQNLRAVSSLAAMQRQFFRASVPQACVGHETLKKVIIFEYSVHLV